MKRIFMSAIFAAVLGIYSYAQQNVEIRFAWDPNPEPNIAKYTLYHRTADVATWSVAVDNIAPSQSPAASHVLTVDGKEHFWVVTATNDLGLESGFSNEVSVVLAPPSAPGGLRKTGGSVVISAQLDTSGRFDTGVRVTTEKAQEIVVSYYRKGSLLGVEKVRLGDNSTMAWMVKADKGYDADVVKIESEYPVAASSVTVGPDRRMLAISMPFFNLRQE